jgi:hypothetical protein
MRLLIINGSHYREKPGRQQAAQKKGRPPTMGRPSELYSLEKLPPV